MRKRKVKLKFKLLLLSLFLAYVGVSFYMQQMDINALLEDQKGLSEQLDLTQTELDRLEHKSEYMSTQDYIENEAREKFGFVYENEYILSPSAEPTQQP
jgi:cell division protein FtsB